MVLIEKETKETKEWAMDWLRNTVAEDFSKQWDYLLSSGAVDPRQVELFGYLFARCVLQRTAANFFPLSAEGKEMLKNLEKF